MSSDERGGLKLINGQFWPGQIENGHCVHPPQMTVLDHRILGYSRLQTRFGLEQDLLVFNVLDMNKDNIKKLL